MKRSFTVFLRALARLPTTVTLALTQSGTPRLPTLTIINSLGKRVPIRVEIADTPAKRKMGLMGRTALAEDVGTLFVFDQERRLSFWMKDTLVPLSIAFIDEEGLIVDIRDMQPLDEIRHTTVEPAKYALEVNQGFFEERGIQVRDQVELPKTAKAGGDGVDGADC